MKVEKIIISKEYLDLPEGKSYVDYAILPNMGNILLVEGQTPPDNLVEVKRERWAVQQIFNPMGDAGEKLKHYLVKIDDRELMDTLMVINNDLLKKKTEENKQSYIKGGMMAGRLSEHGRIKRLPWWKRLFNQF